MAKQSFSSGQTLTAQQMSDLQANDFNLTATTKTGDATLVVGDRGTRVIGNAGTAITFTVPNSTFTASDSVQVHNIGAGTVTIAAGTGLTLNTADVLTLSQYQSGTIYFTSASAAILFPTVKGAAWQSYTPTFTDFTLGNGTVIAKYIQVGKLVAVKLEVTLGSTSSMGTAPQVSLPVTSSSSITSFVSGLGFAVCEDTGTNAFYGTVTFASTTAVYLWFFEITASKVGRGTITSTAPFTWTNTDTFAAQFVYEAA